MKEGLPDTQTMEDFLGSQFNPGAKIGVDPSLYSKTAWDNLEKKLEEYSLNLVGVEQNLIDSIWPTEERPECPKEPVVQISVNYTGKSTKEKLIDLRNVMKGANVEAVVVNQLDDIAWLLNLRGSDIPSAALFLAFVIVKEESFELFIDPVKVEPDIKAALENDGGMLFDYVEITARLEELVRQDQL